LIKAKILEIPVGRFIAEIEAPPSKSISHRALIMAALSGRPCIVENILESDDVALTLNGLEKMGYLFQKRNRTVEFSGRQEKPGKASIDVGNSGTTARLLTAVAAIQGFPVEIDGDQRMRQRPMEPLLNALRRLGARVEHHQGGFPVTVVGNTSLGGRVMLKASKSSQFVSALMIIAPVTLRGIQIDLEAEIPSRSYVEMTGLMMRGAGVYLEAFPAAFKIPGEQPYRLNRWTVENDFSSAAYFLTAAAVSAGRVVLKNMPSDSLQGDRVILDILKKSGAEIRWEKNNLQLRGQRIKGIEYDCQKCPDVVPTLAVLALFAGGDSILKNISHLKFKESDRIAAILNNIRLLGGEASLEDKNLIVRPRKLHGARLPSYDDHRIAMSFALAGLRTAGVNIENPDCVAKSFPAFWDCFLPNIQTEKPGERLTASGRVAILPGRN